MTISPPPSKTSQGSDEHRLIVCRITMPLHADYSTYHYKLSSSHLELEFAVLSRMQVGKTELLEDVEVRGGPESLDLSAEIREGKGVKSVEALERTQDTVVYRVIIEMTPLTKILNDLHLLMRYPTPFDQGIVKLLIVANDQKIRTLLSRLKKIAPGTAITSIRHRSITGPESVLTPRQQEIFFTAMEQGYWEVPRRSSLGNLAQRVDVAKSTLSETLATIEMKLLREVKTLHKRPQ